MPEISTLTLTELQQQEEELVFAAFDEDAAWRLGVGMGERSRSAGHPITIDISTPTRTLFRVTLPGSNADQADWVRRKAAVVFRFGTSSAMLAARVDAYEPGATGLPWLEVRDYAVTGGSFPIRVAGVGVVAAVSVSGLTSDEDHLLAVDALRRALVDA